MIFYEWIGQRGNTQRYSVANSASTGDEPVRISLPPLNGGRIYYTEG